jgi:NAD(P)-dependent dehydrogenase (short-subunit alcohol dehydrogenase family)
MLTLTREIAVSYGRDGVRANAICPGNVYSAMVAGMDEQTREIRRKSSPLGVEGNAWDVAWTALFLASDESRFVNGVTIPVDGGVTLVEPRRARGLLEN